MLNSSKVFLCILLGSLFQLIHGDVYCENNRCFKKEASFICKDGKVLKFTIALWGRHVKSACPDPSGDPKFTENITCPRADVLAKVQAECTGKTECSFPVTSEFFGIADPCPGTYKFVAINYQCISAGRKFATIGTDL